MRFTELYESIIKRDIKAEAKKLNAKYFDGRLDLDFPMGYGAFARSYAKVCAATAGGAPYVKWLKMSSVYDLDDKTFKEMLCHELVHVSIIQSGVFHDTGGDDLTHGANFKAEVDRIRRMGLDVPMKEDVKGVGVHEELTLKTPRLVVARDKEHLHLFTNMPNDYTWGQFLESAQAGAKASGKPILLEFISSVDSSLRSYPFRRHLDRHSYVDTKKIYPKIRKDVFGSSTINPGDEGWVDNPFTKLLKIKGL